jgi:hypothetical protein
VSSNSSTLSDAARHRLTPKKIEMRFGALNFFDDFPQSMAQKLYDNLLARGPSVPAGDTRGYPGADAHWSSFFVELCDFCPHFAGTRL